MYTLVPPLLAVVVLAPAANVSDPGACAALAVEPQSALQALIDEYYPKDGQPDECGLTVRYAWQSALEHGEVMLPCLVEVHRSGLDGTALWPRNTPVPATAPWAIDLIKAVAPETAKNLYREQLQSLDDPLEEAAVWLELARLGDPEGLRQVAVFLWSQDKSDQARVRSLIDEMLEAVAAEHYRPALPGLEKLRGEGWNVNPRLSVFIAQLQGDVESLKGLAAQPGLADAALRSLVAMDRPDVLQALAEDPYYRYRKSARDTLSRARAAAETE